MEELGVFTGAENTLCMEEKLRIRQNSVCEVVYHDRAVEICEQGIRTVLLAYESLPTVGVHDVSFGSGVPEVDSAGRASILRENIDLADKARHALILWCCAEEDRSCFIPRDGLWQPERRNDGDHLDSPSGVMGQRQQTPSV